MPREKQILRAAAQKEKYIKKNVWLRHAAHMHGLAAARPKSALRKMQRSMISNVRWMQHDRSQYCDKRLAGKMHQISTTDWKKARQHDRSQYYKPYATTEVSVACRLQSTDRDKKPGQHDPMHYAKGYTFRSKPELTYSEATSVDVSSPTRHRSVAVETPLRQLPLCSHYTKRHASWRSSLLGDLLAILKTPAGASWLCTSHIASNPQRAFPWR